MKEFLSKLNDMDRRRFVEYAAKSLLGVSLFSTLGRAQAAPPAASPGAPQAAPPDKGAIPAGAITGKAKRLIYLYMSGAMTHIDTFDLKPGHENQGSTRAINTSVPGLQISEYLPTIAQQMQHLAVIRSMSTLTADHEAGEYLMRTSYKSIATERHPTLGPWMQTIRGRKNLTLPDTVLIGAAARHPGGGFFDPSFSPLPIGDPNRGLENTKAPEYLTDESFEKRIKLIDGFDQKFRDKFKVRKVKAYTDYYSEAISLLTSGDLKAFNLNDEKDADRDRYGREPFGQGCLLARRLIENNVQCVEVMLDGWDMHNTIFGGSALPNRSGILDKAVGNLLKDLHARNLLSDTLVVLTTEFGRTPKLNYALGRDHHPAVFSSFLAGGGVKGGQFYGKSDAAAWNVEDKPVYPADFNATIATALSLPLDKIVHSPTGRPFKVANDGVAIKALL